ncbi:MAG TPA: hypothetical protein VGV87_15795 [Blastocatellia bacterium]|jgi:hypothetical protein|nr:hypothetical protein [Blastocatellia bacterium]
MKKSVKVTFETERLLVISGRRQSDLCCHVCGDEALMITVDEAAAMARINSLAVYRLLEAGTLHCAETSAGCLIVCVASLGSLISNQKG